MICGPVFDDIEVQVILDDLWPSIIDDIEVQVILDDLWPSI